MLNITKFVTLLQGWNGLHNGQSEGGSAEVAGGETSHGRGHLLQQKNSHRNAKGRHFWVIETDLWSLLVIGFYVVSTLSHNHKINVIKSPTLHKKFMS